MARTYRTQLEGPKIDPWTRSHPRIIYQLPEPGREWTTDVINVDSAKIELMADKGIIHELDKQSKYTGNRWVDWYTTDTRSYEYAVSKLQTVGEASLPINPCGHTGFCSRPGDLIECPRCGAQFPKQEMQERHMPEQSNG